MTRSIWFWVVVILLWIIGAALLCKCCLCGTSDTTEKTEKISAAPVPAVKEAASLWTYDDGANHRISLSETIDFKQSTFNRLALAPIVDDAVKSSATYLKGHPDRAITITGMYAEEETNNSILPNLGLARANDVSKYLISLGVPAGQIINESKLLQTNSFDKGIFRKGVDFAFTNAKKGDDRIGQIAARLVGKPITLYFGTNQDNINLSAAQRTDFADLIYYLDNVSKASLNVVGHTDGTGDRQYNIQLSRDRAKFVSNYLNKNGGISLAKINSSGLGPDQPIASNATKDGRAKNRRVAITLK